MGFFAYLMKAMNPVTNQCKFSHSKKPSQNVQWLKHSRSLFFTHIKSKIDTPAQQEALSGDSGTQASSHLQALPPLTYSFQGQCSFRH